MDGNPLAVAWRAFLSFVRGLVAWIPALLIAWFGAVYVVSCFNVLLAPGHAVKYGYDGREGRVTIRAGSYTIDPKTRQGILRDVSVTGPDGRKIASATWTRFHYRNGIWDVEVDEVTGNVHRREDGTFDLTGALPAPTDEPSTLVASLKVRKVSLVVSDSTQAPTLTKTIIASDLRVDTSRGDLTAAGLLATDGLLPARVEALLSADGAWQARADIPMLDAVELTPFVERWLAEDQVHLARDLRAASLRTSGRLRLVQAATGPLSVDFDGRVDGRQVTYPGYLQGATVTARLIADSAGMSATAQATETGRSSSFEGRLQLGDDFKLVGNLVANVNSSNQLWRPLREFLPKEVSFRSGRFAGPVHWSNRKTEVGGDVSFGTVRYGEDEIQGVAGRLVASDRQVAFRLNRGQALGVPLEGQISVDLRSRRLAGRFAAQDVDLDRLRTRGVRDLGGVADVAVLVSGTTAKPSVVGTADGALTWTTPEDGLINLGLAEIRGRFVDSRFVIDRGLLNGPLGVVTIKGSVTWPKKALNLEFTAGGIDLAQSVKQWFGAKAPPITAGTGFLSAKATGNVESPVVTGRAEIYGLEGSQRAIPQVVANLRFTDGRTIIAEDLMARIGLGTIEGGAQYRIEDGAIAGTFKGENLLLSDWLGEDVAGQATLETAAVSGTLERPLVLARVTGKDLLVYGVEVDSAEVSVRADEKLVTLVSGQAKVGGGDVVAKGTYTYETGVASGQADLAGVEIDQVAPLPGGIRILGRISGVVNATGSSREDAQAKYALVVNGLDVNGSLVGNGTIAGTYADGVVTGEGEVGSLERYIRLQPSRYNLDEQTVTANVEVFNLNLDDITDAIAYQSSGLDPNIYQALLTSAGSLTFNAEARGPVRNPTIVVSGLVAGDLEANGRELGTIRGEVRRADGSWATEGLTWVNEESVVKLRGSYVEGGQIDAVMEVANLSADVISAFLPRVPDLAGRINATAIIQGTAEDPTGRASLSLTEFAFLSDGKPIGPLASLQLDDVSLENQVVTATGSAFSNGFSGQVQARVPFAAFGSAPKEKFEASLVLQDRDLKAFEEFVPGIDYARSSGTAGGRISLAGSSEGIDVDGRLTFLAEQIAIPGQKLVVNDVNLAVQIDENQARLAGELRSGLGGFVNLDVAADLRSLQDGDFSIESALESTELQGGIRFDAFRLQSRLPNTNKDSDATASGEITVGGVLGEPVIGGRLEMSGVLVVLPSEFPATAGAVEPLVNPQFRNLRVVAAPGTELLVSTGKIVVNGTATVDGSLLEPEITAPLTLESGTFRLPTSRLTLEPGGQINASYAGNPAVGRVDIDISGTTTVTARQSGDQYQTYVITLDIRGNLLDENGVRIVGTSDPGDLTNEQILAIIGQRDLIETLAGTAFGRQRGSDLRDAIYSIAVPAFTYGLTEQIATSLKLDYLTLDYNPFDQAIVRFGKTLGKGLMLQASRQLANPQFGKTKFEVKLTYRLPLRDQFFGRLRLGFGFDQDRPWKFTLDWSRRF